jgi:hypothetical protein
MSEIRDEPAFPNEWCNELGMSMRDYFAAKAMQGIQSRVNWDISSIARLAYEQADAMLIVRAENE